MKTKIVALEQLWNQVYKSGDIKALNSILDDGIVLVNDDGSVQNKAEFLASVRSSAAVSDAQQQQVAPEAFNVHVFGNVAIATGVMRVKSVEGGKSYTRRERFVDPWLLKHGPGYASARMPRPYCTEPLTGNLHLAILHIPEFVLAELARIALDESCCGLHWDVLDWNVKAIELYP